MSTHLTDADRLAIRTELAKAMGWKYMRSDVLRTKAWHDPSGHLQNAPNPFTSAADNRALVEWIAAQEETIRLRFHTALKIEAGYDNHPFYTLRAHEALASPLETIALAAAAALGITVSPPEAAPAPALSPAQRRE